METNTSAARPDEADNIPANINPISFLRIMSPSLPSSTLCANLHWRRPSYSCCGKWRASPIGLLEDVPGM